MLIFKAFKIMNMSASFRFRLGALCALKPISEKVWPQRATKKKVKSFQCNVPMMASPSLDNPFAFNVAPIVSDKFWPVVNSRKVG